MLNQSKLYLGRLPYAYGYRISYLSGDTSFNEGKIEVTARPYLFWLQQFMDELSNNILRTRGR